MTDTSARRAISRRANDDRPRDREDTRPFSPSSERFKILSSPHAYANHLRAVDWRGAHRLATNCRPLKSDRREIAQFGRSEIT